MIKLRLMTAGGIAAAAMAVSLPMLPAQAQVSAITASGSGSTHMMPPPVTTQDPVTSPDPAMTISAGPFALGIAGQLAAARQATAKFATNLGRAKTAGYQILTKMIPNMGFHFINLKIQGFDIRKPPILVYEHTGTRWQLAALEWVFPKIPSKLPLPNATFGSFPAACHYTDGTFIPKPSQDQCPAKAPGSGAKFTIWHPELVTMHVWAWYPNPVGLFSSMNPLVSPFNHG
jgi:hypothetical protein